MKTLSKAAIVLAAAALAFALVVSAAGVPVALDAAVTPDNLTLNKLAEFDTGFSDAEGGVAEIVKYNTDNGRFYLVNGKTQTVDIVTLRKYGDNGNEAETVFDENTDRIDFTDLVAEHGDDFADGFVVGDITSVAVNTDLDVIAVAVQHEDYDARGAVVLLDYDGGYVAAYAAGVQPDMVTFAGNIVLTADEGEPRMGYENGTDPKGSVTAVDLSAGTASGTPETVYFDDFDSQRDSLTAAGVVIMKDAAPSVDFEPEYITALNGKAYVALQEANSIAVLDLESLEFESVMPLGFKDHSVEGSGLDMLEDGEAKIETQEVFGVYMPDGIEAFSVGGETYIATANEGDAREWEEYEGITKKTYGDTKVEVLDNEKWDGLASDETYLLGARSFSVFKASDMSLVYDSGDSIESVAASDERTADYFNCSNDDNELDSRSKKKGPEPEAVKVMTVNGNTYVCVALERQGGVMVYDVTDMSDVSFVSYSTTRDYSQAMAGDVAPESLDFVPAAGNDLGRDLLIVSNENSGTVGVFAVEDGAVEYEMHSTYVKAETEPAEPADHPVISFVYGSGDNDDGAVSHNAIAISNPTDEEADLSGWSLAYSTMRDAEAGAEREWSEYALSVVIPAGGTYVIIGESANAAGDAALTFGESDYNAVWEGLVVDNKQYSLRLCDADGGIVDALGVTDGDTSAETGEGNVIDGEVSKQKILYRADLTDTDDNASDFTCVSLKDADEATAEQYRPEASACIKTYAVKVTAQNATVSVADGSYAKENSTLEFTVTAASGYSVTEVKVNGAAVTASGGKYSVTVTGATEITVGTAAAQTGGGNTSGGGSQPDDPEEPTGGCNGSIAGGITLAAVSAAILLGGLIIAAVKKLRGR